MRNKKERGNTGDEVLINRKVIQAFYGSGPNEQYWKPSEMRANQYMCAAPVHYDSLRPSRGCWQPLSLNYVERLNVFKTATHSESSARDGQTETASEHTLEFAVLLMCS